MINVGYQVEGDNQGTFTCKLEWACLQQTLVPWNPGPCLNAKWPGTQAAQL